MRLHRLEATAFGPFAGTVEVDLDHLSQAGLFLLTGATGAGKTSVLDAVCFALYGDVPGDRGAAKRLRSDQAAPGVRPRVELELTVSGRRLRLVRSPAWQRAKRRGTGTTTEQASVVLSEHGADGWRTLSTRLDETGHLVGDLLGMTLSQFTQVAMLPQGRFQAFLRARSEDRHRLLQQLFRTGRFEQVETWLRDRRSTLRRSSAELEQQVADLVSRVSEAAAAEPPSPQDEWPELVPCWADDLRAAAARDLAAATEAVAAAAAAETGSRAALDEARARAERARRRSRAVEELARLEETSSAHERDVAALAAARRAAPVLLAERHRVEVEHEAAAASRRVDERLRGLDVPAGDAGRSPDPALLERVEERLVSAAASARDALPRARELAAAEARLPALREARGAAAARAELLEAELATWPERTTAARERLAQHHATAVALPVHEAARDRVEQQLAAAAESTSLEQELVVARADHLAARERAVASHERLLQVREERIGSMAAELAGALAIGACCPVCGSAEHPAKAEPGPGATDAALEREAQRRLDDDKSDEHARAMHVRDLETRRDLARERAGGLAGPGGDVEAAHAELERLRAACADAAAARSALAGLTAAVDDLERRQEEQRRALDAARADLAVATEEHRGCLRDVERLEAAVASAATSARRALDRGLAATAAPGDLDGHDDPGDDWELPLEGRPDLAALHAALVERAAAVRAVRASLATRDTAREALATASRRVEEAAADAGFADTATALAAALPPDDEQRLEQAVTEHRSRLAAVRAVLAETADEQDAPVADVAVLAEAHRRALADLGTARSRAGLLTERCGRLAALADDLAAALDTWTPVREQLALTHQLSSLVEGRSADNALQMRLSAYVLAWRLSQVVAAANDRLGRMSDRRYSLEHTGRRGAGETRGGLSLLVRDDWSGESRDPATLSGGETFVVSLALALGLADVISQEAGGAELDTLFVDEGFGSLDADTLEDVMDTLDSLREGGRVVGVVSHVAEMRDRIPTQLHVSKGRTGSTVALRHGS